MLRNRWDAGCFTCVGLDPLISKIPQHLKEPGRPLAESLYLQLKGIIDETSPVACAFKPNFGFYASMPNLIGFGLLRRVIDYIHEHYPMIPVILDTKNNDIGASSDRYATAAFSKDCFGADAITVNPFLGGGAISPFIQITSGEKNEIVTPRETGVFVLCRTSNPDAAEIQDREVIATRSELIELGLQKDCVDMLLNLLDAGCIRALQPKTLMKDDTFAVPFYIWIALLVSKKWNKHGNYGLVVGATMVDQLKKVRMVVGNMSILNPGVGTQGAKLHEVVPAAMDSNGVGFLVNNSSGIMFASNGVDSAEKAGKVARAMNDEIKKLRATALIERSAIMAPVIESPA